MVGYLETILLAQILDAVHQLTGKTFGSQFGSDVDIQSHSQGAFVGNKPSLDILGDNLHGVDGNPGHFAFDFKVDVAVCFQSRYFGSSHRFDSCCRGFHALAEHRTKTFEIGVYTLHEHGVVVADHLDILNVDLGSNDRSYRLDICGGRSVGSRQEHLGQRLAYFDVGLLAESESKRCKALCQRHATFQRGVDKRGVRLGEFGQMHAGGTSKVAEQTVAEERCHRGGQQCQGGEAGMEGLICGKFVGIHFAAPETLAVETHIPVGKIVEYETSYRTHGAGGLIVVVGFGDFLHKRVQQ